jgi:GNAT superfamily N-acetyltransferase
MLEIRTYDGDAGPVNRLLSDVWSAEYQGRIPFSTWGERLIDWQLLAEELGGRDYLVAAYDQARLVGILFAEPFLFSLRGRETHGTIGRHLTVHPDSRSQLVAFRLLSEFRQRHIDRGCQFCLGFRLGGVTTPSGAFWTGMRKAMPGLTADLGRIGYWVRILDASAVARWSKSLHERYGALALGLLQRIPKPRHGQGGIRTYRPEDLPDCLRLARNVLNKVDLGYSWTSTQLGHQLQYKDIARTMVADDQGSVGGFVNYYILDCWANGLLRVAMIDLLALDDLEARTARDLLTTTLAQMEAEGAQIALLLRLRPWPWRHLLAAGFVPVPTDHSVVCLRIDPSLSLRGIRHLYIHYR